MAFRGVAGRGWAWWRGSSAWWRGVLERGKGGEEGVAAGAARTGRGARPVGLVTDPTARAGARRHGGGRGSWGLGFSSGSERLQGGAWRSRGHLAEASASGQRLGLDSGAAAARRASGASRLGAWRSESCSLEAQGSACTASSRMAASVAPSAAQAVPCQWGRPLNQDVPCDLRSGQRCHRAAGCVVHLRDSDATFSRQGGRNLPRQRPGVGAWFSPHVTAILLAATHPAGENRPVHPHALPLVRDMALSYPASGSPAWDACS